MTIDVPARLGELDPLPAEAGAALGVVTSLRGCATSVSDVADTMAKNGAPADWQGSAAEAAENAMTGFARHGDAIVAAFETVLPACDRYVDDLADLAKAWNAIDGDRIELNTDRQLLLHDIAGSTEAQTQALQDRAAALTARRGAIAARVSALWADLTAAEDRLIDAFAGADSTAEGAALAGAADRVDTEALAAYLQSLHDPRAVHDWWTSLTDAEREALKVSDPDLVGNTNGIPTGDRDEANRTSLDRDLDHLQSLPPDELTTEQQRQLERAEQAEKALGIPGLDIDPNTGLPVDVNLIAYDPTAFGGDGVAAVGYGDPDTADNTVVIVPGMMNDASTIAGNAEDAYRLYQQAGGNGESAAAIAWMGYDSPNWNPESALDFPGDGLDVGSVATEGKAREGGELLSEFVDGLRATDTGDQSHLSVIGHSYGSTTSAIAAAEFGLHADSLTLIGSPGAGGDDVNGVGDLHMPEGKVYAGAADNDFVSWLGRDGELGMGQDPTQQDFGATVFPVDPGDTFHVDEVGSIGIDNHTSYFDPGSTSLDNLTAIVQGDEPTVVGGRTEDANDLALDWAKDEAGYQVGRGVDSGRTWVEERWEDFSDLWR